MLPDAIGPPQIAALLVLAQRGLEELYSQRNTRVLLAAGAHEVGRAFYPVVAVTHLAWIAGLFLLLPPDAPVSAPLLGLYLALQGVRYWVIATLGRYWTHRIITLAGAPVVRHGPYRLVRHPNYAVTITETFLLPLVFGGWALAAILGAVWCAVLRYKIVLEDGALAERSRSMAQETHRSAATK
jgi:methyltransferase